MKSVEDGLEFDARGLTNREIMQRLSSFDDDAHVLLHLDSPIDRVLAGLDQALTLTIKQPVGDYTCMMASQALVHLESSAGHCVGHSLISGELLARGDLGDYAGAFARGGFIAGYAKAGRFVGYGLAGADLFVRGSVADQAGYGMRSGALILGKNAGPNLGAQMRGGVIFLRGKVESVADEAMEVKMKDADALKLSLLLARAGVRANNSEFQVFKARGSV